MKKIIIFTVIMALMLVSSAFGAMTVTNKTWVGLGNKTMLVCDGAFDSSYPWGGEGLDYTSYGFGAVDYVFASPTDGYTFEYDVTNKKLKAFVHAPPIVYEEKHTAAANTITLDYPAAWIISVSAAGAGYTWTKIQKAATLDTDDFCLVSAIADGVRTQLYVGGATDTVYVTYATQAWAELYNNLVQEEAITLLAAGTEIDNAMMAYGYCVAATSGVLVPVDAADTPADGEINILMSNSTSTSLTPNAAQNTEAAVITYIKEPASGWLLDHYVADEDPTKSGSDPYLNTFDFPSIMWCISGFATVNSGVTQNFIDSFTTPGAKEINTNWGYTTLAPTGAAPASGLILGGKSNVTITAGSYIKGYPWEIPNVVPLEVKNGVDMSGVTGVKLQIIGR